MKKLAIAAIVLLKYVSLSAQPSVFPSENNEYCPFVTQTFTVTLPIIEQNTNIRVFSLGPAVVVQDAYAIINIGSTNTQFTFRGFFQDVNSTPIFYARYTPKGQMSEVSYDMRFKKIKSLFGLSLPSKLIPNISQFNAPRCQVSTFNLSFPNFRYGNGIDPTVPAYGNPITAYEYLLPLNWKLGSTTSTGQWIQAGSSVTITSDLSTGDMGAVRIRALNTDCGVNLLKSPKQTIPISRPEPPLAIPIATAPLCTGTKNFTLSGIPTGATVAWSSSDPTVLAITQGVNSPTVTVTRLGMLNREITLTATVTHCTFTYYRTVDIVVGTGVSNLVLTYKQVECVGRRPFFFGTVQPLPKLTAINYEWFSRDERTPGNPFVFQQSGNINTADFELGGFNAPYTIKVIAYNACGSVTVDGPDGMVWTPASCQGGGYEQDLQAVPNPAKTTITLKNNLLKTTDAKSNYNAVTRYIITNLTGNTLLEVLSKTANTEINVSKLKPGLYFIKTWSGKKWITTKFIKH
jgi:hypothetical protein